GCYPLGRGWIHGFARVPSIRIDKGIALSLSVKVEEGETGSEDDCQEPCPGITETEEVLNKQC
ncbi:MAG: hypothetical protein ACRDHW_20420, partial [Ktedonobacteraceae bacterium]